MDAASSASRGNSDGDETASHELDRSQLESILRSDISVQFIFMCFDLLSDKDATEKQRVLEIVHSIVDSVFVDAFELEGLSQELVKRMIEDENLERLAKYMISSSTPQLRREQMKLARALAIGNEARVLTSIIFYLLNEFSEDTSTIESLSDDVIKPLFVPVQLNLGADVFSSIAQTIEVSKPRSETFWQNLSALTEHETFRSAVKLNLDKLTDHFTEIMLEPHGVIHYGKVFHVLKLLQFSLGRNIEEGRPAPKHPLCSSLAVNYFSLIESLHENFGAESDGDEQTASIIMQSLIIAQKCMNSLANWLPLNQQFLCRSLLDLAVVSGHLFTHVSSRPLILDSDDSKLNVNLLYENRRLEGSHSMRFRKTALVPKSDLPLELAKKNNENNVMNRQAAMDAFRASAVDMKSFASLFIDIVSPDVLYNDQFWPDEECLKVTIERDLVVFRRFERNPLLWDLLKHISEAGLLSECALIIRALLAIQLTQWGAATPGLDGKLESTKRLISLIAEGGLVPTIPCKYLAGVVTLLKPWEIHCLLTDIYRYLKEKSNTSGPVPIKPFLERLRVIMSIHYPGPQFVQIFKSLCD